MRTWFAIGLNNFFLWNRCTSIFGRSYICIGSITMQHTSSGFPTSLCGLITGQSVSIMVVMTFFTWHISWVASDNVDIMLYRRIINLLICDGDCLIQFVIFVSAELAVTGQISIHYVYFICSAGTTLTTLCQWTRILLQVEYTLTSPWYILH